MLLPSTCWPDVPTSHWHSSPHPRTCSPYPLTRWTKPPGATPRRAASAGSAGRYGCSAGVACSRATTRRAPTRASTTVSCRSRDRTTHWPNGCNGGRATVARAAGTTVCLTVAPATRTRSVVRNRLLAAAFAGAHRFGIEVFEPATSNTLMAALLEHHLRAAPPAQPHPWQDEAYAAAHGGLWRQPDRPGSALGLAVLLGIGSARRPHPARGTRWR